MRTGWVIADRFQIHDSKRDLLGRGGMGDVYRGTDAHTGELVAIKALDPRVVARDPGILERFVREGEALRQLNHPNIVRMIAAIEDADATTGVVGHYLVMEYVAGGSLQDLLDAQAPLLVSRVVEIALDLADALTRAHRLGIIHRDLKPANVLLAEDGTPRLTDFGIARLSEAPRLTQTGVLVGTPDFVSPEACEGEPIDERGDIWSFGVMLYEMLTGETPFQGDSLSAKLAAILTQPVPDLAQRCPDAPEALVNLVHRMLEKDRQQRIPSVRLVGAELEAILKGREVPTPLRPAPEETRVAPASTAAARRAQVAHNLPAQLTSFVGREREMEDVKHLLKTSRLLTLTGTGGTGKTRLSLQVAAGLLHDFEDGVFFVGLASIRDPALVAPTIAGTLDVRQAGDRPLPELLKDYLRDKHMLLVLDNFEQVLDAAPQVSELLSTAPQLNLLVTSRELLRVYGEQGYPVPPLATPDPQEPPSVEQLAQVEAVQLFLQRARVVRPDFALSADNAAAVAEICGKLDGLPLALELAAARLRLFPSRKILAQLDSRLQFLSGGARDVPARHRTLRATIDWSYNLLDAEEKTLFRRLAVFVGGCTLEAAEAVCSIHGDLDVLNGLEGLVDKNLLYASVVAGNSRLGMLETIREYALERLTESEEVEAIQRQHAGFFLALAKEAEPELDGAETTVWMNRLEVEQDNLRAALAWSLDRAVEVGLQLAGVLGRFWQMHAEQSEGRDWLAKALAKSEGCGPELDHLRAKALNAAGELASDQSDNDAAASLQKDSIALYRALGDELGRAHALRDLGAALYARSDLARARSLIEESINLFTQLGDRLGLVKALFWHGHVCWREGDTEAAHSSAEKSRALAQELGAVIWMAAPTSTLGRIALDQGDYTASQFFFEESLGAFRQTRDKVGLAIVLDALGGVSYLQGFYERARVCWQESLEIWRKVGDEAATLCDLAYVSLQQNDGQESRALFTESLALLRQGGDRRGIAACLVGLAGVAEREGQPATATRLLGAVEAILESGIVPLLISQAEYDRTADAARARLDEVAFRTAWADGRARDLEATVAELLADLGEKG